MNNLEDLISRTAAIKTFTGKPPEYYHTSYIVDELNCVPAVDAAPVIHAWWRELKDGTEECTNCLGLCPHEENYNGDVIFNFGCEYCPWCGAKMNGERRNENGKIM